MGRKSKRRKGRKDHKPENKNRNTTTNNQNKDTKNSMYQQNKNTSQVTRQPVTAQLACDFYMDTDVKARFDEYARAAKTEIGGLIRVQKNEAGDYVATDLKIFPQNATGATFELDEDAVTKFMMELHREGRDAEMMEWQNIIHSHPNNTRPFLSGVDRPNLISCAGSERWAWSVIMTRKDTISTDGTEYKVHFYQAAGASPSAVGVLIQDLPVLLVDRRRAEIEAEVKELIAKPVQQSYTTGGMWRRGAGALGFRTGHDDDDFEAAVWAGSSESKPSSLTQQELMALTATSDEPKGTMTNAEAAAFQKDIAEAVVTEFEEMGIDVGAIVKFTPNEYSMVGEEEENVKILTDMADQEFVVESFDGHGRAVFNGFGFDPDEVELVQSVEEVTTEITEVEVPETDDAEATAEA